MSDRLFEEWRVYEKLVVHDYMDHRAFFDRLQIEILARFRRPVAILDLGCGDLKPALPMLAKLPVKRYVGVDDSEVALGLAAGSLEAARIPGRLIKGDLLQSLSAIGESFDVILASFALHHLADPEDKLRTLEAAGRMLTADGLFALIDVFSSASEPREHYLARWIEHARARYTALEPEEKELLFQHVRARDFPLSVPFYRKLARRAGLGRFEVLLQDEARLNCLVTLARDETSGGAAPEMAA